MHEAGARPARRRHRHLRRRGSCRAPTGGWHKPWHEPRAGAGARRARDAAAPIRTRRSARSSSRDGAVVGEGVTERNGGPHGEIVALEAAGERARGATLYVTMEPCAHHGRRRRASTPCSPPGSRASSPARSTRTPRRGAARPAARRRCRGRARRLLRGAAPERGLAHLDRARPSVRHLQGRRSRSTAASRCPASAG